MAFSVSLSGPVRHRVSSRKTPRKNKRIAGPHKNASPYSKCLLHGQLNTTCWQISWTPNVKATMEQYIKVWRDFLKSSELMMLLMVDVIVLMLINHGGWILVNNKFFTISNKRIKLSCTFVWPVRFELAYISDILVIFQFQTRDTSVKHGIITISRSLFSNYEQKPARRKTPPA